MKYLSILLLFCTLSAFSQSSIRISEPNTTTSGTYNTMVGVGVAPITTGDGNVFMGYQSGFFNTTGTNNTFLGNATGFNNSTGLHNTFVGSLAGNQNTQGRYNVFIGRLAGGENQKGYSNSFVGVEAGRNNISGTNNVAIGDSAGFSNDTKGSVFIGSKAGYSNTVGTRNTFVGYLSGYTSTTSTQNTHLGSYAGSNHRTGDNNTYIGALAGLTQRAGTGNTYLGAEVNSIVGFRNGSAEGSYNTMVGASAGARNQATGNTFVGYESGNTGTRNANEMQPRLGGYNTYVGFKSGHYITNGTGNVGVGSGAGYMNVDGGFNVAIGDSSLFYNISSENTAIGDRAGYLSTYGSGCLYLGKFAGYNDTFGVRNTLLGYKASVLNSNLSNATAIGAFALVSAPNSIVLGDTSLHTKVGIGITAPQFALDVRGIINIRDKGTLKFSHLNNPTLQNGHSEQFLTVNADGETVLAEVSQLSEMQAKVEQLTGYLLELKKENNAMKERLGQLERVVNPIIAVKTK